ncbi:hypothetical protein [Microbacterium sp. VKM Ac-2870]|uniref:hypothetical protein n=1 Tax=Microbacterium sp. VKM Ac-2870 TaxID=2783825 RepID=UPI001E31E93D|nr:hypothetical protein [Microbacterium sp. VKM Ac-2870]
MTSAPEVNRALGARVSDRAREWWPRALHFAFTRRGLLIGFAVVHSLFFLALLKIMIFGGTEGDLPLYRLWAEQAAHGHWPVIDMPWVYPAGALAPIMAAIVAGPWNYQLVWLLMMVGANFFAVMALTDNLRNRKGYTAAWYWLAIQILLAPVSMLRLEGFAAPLAIAGLVWLVRRPTIAGALIAAATWIKVAPAALAAAAVVVSSLRMRIIAGGLAISAAIAGIVIALGGGSYLFSFATIQGDRALQLEAPVATPWVWATVLGMPGAQIHQNYVLATREVAGPGATAAGVLVGYAMPVAFAVIVFLLWRARRRALQAGPLSLIGEQHLILRGAFALTSALIVFNKVGSPQYMLWLAPVVAAGLFIDRKAWTQVAIWLAVTCFLTTLVFPVLYLPLIDAHPFAAGVLLARNVLLVGLFGWSLVALWRPDATLAALRERIALGTATGSVPVAVRG